MFPGIGTVVNIVGVLVGATIGALLGERISQRTRDTVTDALGLVTLLIAAESAFSVFAPEISARVGTTAPVLIVLGAMALGGIAGSLLRLQDRVEGLGSWLQRRLSRDSDSERRARWIEGFVVSSLLFCTGPLTIVGSLNDGLGNGADELFLKSTLDTFAALAFAASFGWGVAASAFTVLAVQGSLTALGFALGDVLPAAEVAMLTGVGGLLLAGIALRLLQIRQVPVVDLLPALILAPLAVAGVGYVTS